MHDVFGTFQYVDRDTIPHGNLITKPIFTLNYSHDNQGNITGRRVRCSYRGNQLIPNFHYDAENVATHTVDRAAMRLLMAVSAQLGLELYHVDLKSAFLHEDYKGTVPLYMEIPPHFDGSHRFPGKVARIVKNIFGTPNAPKIYIDGLRRHLVSKGYYPLKSDTNVYVKRERERFIAMAITIDDFAVATKYPDMYRQLVNDLREKYMVKDMGSAKQIIGWTIKRNGSAVHISQPHLAETFLHILDMLKCNPKATPYAVGLNLQEAQEEETILNHTRYPYSTAIGVLRYLVDSTRPDLAYITGALARHMARPTMRHWKALKAVARYIAGTKHYGILYTKGSATLTAYADADFAGCSDTRQSTYGNVIAYAGAPISWTSRRIKTVVTSTCAAEYIAASNTALQIQWLRHLVSELIAPLYEPTRLAMDNEAAKKIATTTAPTRKSKYIDIRYHHLRDKVRIGEIRPEHIPTMYMTADIFTKPLPQAAFIRHRDNLSLVPLQQTCPRL